MNNSLRLLSILFCLYATGCTGTLNNMNERQQKKLAGQYSGNAATISVKRSTRLTQTAMHALIRSPQEISPDLSFSMEAGLKEHDKGVRYKDGPIACKAGFVKIEMCFDCGNNVAGFFPATLTAQLKPGGMYSIEAESTGMVLNSVKYTLRDTVSGTTLSSVTVGRRSFWNP